MNTAFREKLKDKQRIVIKIGSSSLTHPDTGYLDLIKLEVLVREISDLRNQGKDVILVSSGAIMVGSKTMGYDRKPSKMAQKQACAAIGQAKLMMIYQKLFAEYNQVASQILMTKHTILNNLNRLNAKNTFEELLRMGAIPIVNENDTISAVVSAMVGADLLILLSDIDGLFTDDPHKNPEAKFIDVVEELDEHLLSMGKGSTGSNVGTGGMAAKLAAAQIATDSGSDMVIANAADFHVIHKIMQGRAYGTLFLSHKKNDFYVLDFLERIL